SSRRRHTRFSRDWSSDVCSSDLETGDISRFLIRHPIKTLKQLLLVDFANSNTFVAYSYAHRAATQLALDMDTSSARRVFNGIVHKVDQYLSDFVAVAKQADHVASRKRNLMTGTQQLGVLHNFFQQRTKVKTFLP